MSKYLGKLLVEAGLVSIPNEVSVKYVKSRKAFCFKVDRNPEFYVDSVFCFKMVENRGMLPFQFKWSTGYAVREKKGVESIKELRLDEYSFLGGRKDIFWKGLLESDNDFDMICVIQYAFVLCPSVLVEVIRTYKRHRWGRLPNHATPFMCLRERELGKSGRKKGSKNVVKGSDEEETFDDIVSRCEHNLRVAVAKGFFEWYLEAYKEMCKAKGQKFDKELCLKQWNEERAKIGQ